MLPGSLNHEPDKNAIKYFLHLFLNLVSVTNNHEKGQALWGGGGTPLCSPYRYVLPQRVRFMGLSGLKSGMVFEETMGE